MPSSTLLCSPCYIDERMEALLKTFYDRSLKEHAAQFQSWIGADQIAKIPDFYRKHFLAGSASRKKITIQVRNIVKL